MITLLFICAFFIAVFHLIYDGIVLPSVLLHFRNRLFCLRDELRGLHLEETEERSKEVFLLLDEGIGRFLKRLPMITPIFHFRMERTISKDPALREEIQKRIEMIEECSSPDFRRIYKDVNNVLAMTLVANIGAWFVYLVPILMLVFLFARVTTFVTEALLIPSKDVGKFFSLKTAPA